MLNEILQVMEEDKVFERLGSKKTASLIQKIIHISLDYDCNQGEILDGIGEKLGICRYCAKSSRKLTDGLCQDCRVEMDMTE
jgi:hypothetical protein